MQMAPSTHPFQGLNLPYLPPPPNVQPDFIHPQSHAFILVILSSIFLALTIFLFIVRVYTKLYIVKKWAWDDCK